MKIFLIKSKSKGLLLARGAGFAIPLVLALAIVISQARIFMSGDAVPASSDAVSCPGECAVTLVSDRPLSGSEVSVLIDGEKAASFDGTAVVLDINRTSVIEVFSKSNEPFTVAAEAGGGIETFGQKRVFECTKGINFICRCYRPVV